MSADAAQLLHDLRPRLHYDRDEAFFADAPQVLVENHYHGGPGISYSTRLMRADGDEVIATAAPDDAFRQLDLDFLRPGTYPTGDDVLDGDFLDPGLEWVADGRSGHASGQYADHVYGRTAPSRYGGQWLQYWLFYFASVKGIPSVRSATGPLGFGLHAGDWEMIQLYLPKGSSTATQATYAAHDYAYRVDPEEEKWVDSIPDIYVAVGSHASYPRPGKWRNLSVIGLEFLKKLDDRCVPETIIRPQLTELDGLTDGWWSWPGYWGRPGPKSPACQRKWSDPDHLHDSARVISDGLRDVALKESGATEAEAGFVEVNRTENRVTIAFDVPPERDDAWGAMLTIAVESPDEQLPFQWVYDVTAPGRHRPVA